MGSITSSSMGPTSEFSSLNSMAAKPSRKPEHGTQVGRASESESNWARDTPIRNWQMNSVGGSYGAYLVEWLYAPLEPSIVKSGLIGGGDANLIEWLESRIWVSSVLLERKRERKRKRKCDDLGHTNGWERWKIAGQPMKGSLACNEI